MKRFMFLSMLLAVIAFTAQAQSSAHRYALVIGNARYQHIESLTNLLLPETMSPRGLKSALASSSRWTGPRRNG
jgi:hypothetical protein